MIYNDYIYVFETFYCVRLYVYRRGKKTKDDGLTDILTDGQRDKVLYKTAFLYRNRTPTAFLTYLRVAAKKVIF